MFLLSVTEAVILAAGLGKRVGGPTKPTPKPLLKVLNLPLIAYPIANLLVLGVKRLNIVVNPYNYEPITNLVRNIDIDANFIINEYPEKGNGFSLLLGMRNTKNEIFIVSMADHIHHPSIFRLLVERTKNFDIIVGSDSNPTYIDVNEATKVFARENRVLSIGKTLTKFTHIDIGLFLFRKRIIREYEEYCKDNETIELSDLVRLSISRGHAVFIADVRGKPWIDIDTLEDIKKAETRARDFIERVKQELAIVLNRFV